MESGKNFKKVFYIHQITILGCNLLICSIGSLGKGNSTATVSAIVLDTAFLKNTTNGLRIKTWQVKSQVLDPCSFF